MKIAITGGIGAGKSEVMKIISNLGYPTVFCDEINDNLLKDSQYISKIEKAFPEVVVDGKVDKSLLREVVFSNEDKRKLLNSISHPEILKKAFLVEGDFVFIEIPLIPNDIIKQFDKIICVTSNIDTRVNRIVSRSGGNISKSMAKKIILCQPNDDLIKAYSHFVIENNDNICTLKSKVLDVINNLKR